MAKPKKNGTIAIPFLMTFLGALVVVGGTAIFFLNFLLNDDNDAQSSSSYVLGSGMPTKENNSTLLFIIDSGNDETDLVFLVLRSLPSSLKMVAVPIAPGTVTEVDSQTATVGEFYRQAGGEKAKSAISSALGIEIDRFIKMDSVALDKLYSIMGGVTYNVPENIPDIKSGEYNLNSSQYEMLITYSKYSEGENFRMKFIGGSASKMINNGIKKSFASRLDSSFNSFIGLIVTDINAKDFENAKNAISYIAINASNPCQLRIPSGVWNNNQFTINDTYKENLKEWMEIS